MSECIHEYRLEFGEMVCDHCGYGQRHIELEVARQRIATQEATIKALREQLKSPSHEEWAALERKGDYWRDKSKEQTKTIAALRDQLAEKERLFGEAKALLVDAPLLIKRQRAVINELTEQLARMEELAKHPTGF